LVGVNGSDAAAIHGKARDGDAFVQFRPVHPRALGEGLGDVGRAGLPVGRQPACADQIGRVHQGPHAFHLIGGNQVHLHPEGAGGGGEAAVFGPAVGVGGKAQAARHLPAGIKARLGGEALVKIDRVFQHLGDGGRGAKLAHQPRRVPCAARGDLALFQQDHIGLVVTRQMIGGGTADDAAADDDDLGMGGEGHFFCPCREWYWVRAVFSLARFSRA
jgi:hypothetical protein